MKQDQQTGLFNMIETERLIDEYLGGDNLGAHALLLIDIDEFSKINDAFGRVVADTIISDLSVMIQKSFRNTDIVGRIGGDEFIVFMKQSTKEIAEKKARQLCENAKKVIYGGEERLQVTVSIGGVFGKEETSYEKLFEWADEAAHMVKKSGGNGFLLKSFGCEEIQIKNRYRISTIAANENRFDRELLNRAYDLLSHAKDMDLSLNLLLEQIAKWFDLNLVSLFLPAMKKPQMTMTNSWSNLGKMYDRDIIPRSWQFFEKEPVGVFVELAEVIEHAKLDEITKARYEEWNKNQIQNMAAIKFEISNDGIGELHIGTIKKGVRWTADEKATIGELSRIVGIFVSLRNRTDEDKKIRHELRQREKLTGLYDKDAFKTKVESIMKIKVMGYFYAVAVMDINNFAYINDNFGTEIGDKILRDLASILNHKNSKTKFSCRMYSDYFATFISGATKEEVVSTVAKITKTFEERLNEKYPMGRISLSAGICFIESPQEYEIVLENANVARKYAKEHGFLNGIVFENYMRHKRDELVEVSSKFNDAINNEEFEVYLQPKFFLNDFKIYGAEAIVRWRQVDGTIVPPIKFVPSFEMTGQIVELDFVIFEKVLAVMKKWMREGKEPVIISTNFSRRHFDKNDQSFAKRIKKLAQNYEIPAEYIEIELTESTIADNLDVVRKNMEELKKSGFRIAIDDFGTGYSSLHVLLEIPADVIKMDKAFTDKLHIERNRQFVSKMGMLIKAANHEVIFEGIETKEQLEHLKESGFEYGQGYLCDRPLPVEEFEKKYLFL